MAEEQLTSEAQERLANFIDRVERLEEHRSEVQEQIKFVYAEAKAEGFDPKIMRQTVRLRRIAKEQREEQQALVDLYLSALGS